MKLTPILIALAALSVLVMTGCSHDDKSPVTTSLPPAAAASVNANTAPGGGPPPGVMQANKTAH